mmetsp:Transcript_5839/g.8574  ORF Transcript_5839/g.8574 Transcript_5839/m.8574 type:complete len:887 (+) Transcript_5839:2-2662(+)
MNRSKRDGENNSKNNFSVVIRVRPPLDRELNQKGYKNVIRVERMREQSQITISENLEGEDQDQGLYNTHMFSFDNVYRASATQSEVYENTAQQAVLSTLEGYNATIIAYGQTGTGKTYTMEGSTDDGTGTNRGIIPRSTEEIFNYIQNKGNSKTKFLVRAAYLQIYKDAVSDLLKPERNHLKIRQGKKRGVFVENLSEWVVRSPQEVYGLMSRGAKERVSGHTRVHDRSSRSHAIFMLIIEQSETTIVDPKSGAELDIDVATWKRLPENQRKGELRQTFKIGKLNLVDLAGSERQRFSGATGIRYDELKQINKSLSALGHVIKRLTSGSPQSHVPYRNSKLTRILEDSLGGNCKTTMMAMVSPALESFLESLSTLKFVHRAKSIKNKAQINQDLDQRALLRRYERELKRLRSELGKKGVAVDKNQLAQLQQEKRNAEEEKLAALTALEKRSREFMLEKQAKRKLEEKIAVMQSNLLIGGEKIEHSPAFRELLNKEYQRVHREYSNRLQELERERQSIDEDKAQVDRYKQLLLKQRDIMIALTARLNERDETIIGLQEELDAYDHHQQMLETALDRKTTGMLQLQKMIDPSRLPDVKQIVEKTQTDDLPLNKFNRKKSAAANRLPSKRNIIVNQSNEDEFTLNNSTWQQERSKLQKENEILRNQLNSMASSGKENYGQTTSKASVVEPVAMKLNTDVKKLIDSTYKSVCELQDDSNVNQIIPAKASIVELGKLVESLAQQLTAQQPLQPRIPKGTPYPTHLAKNRSNVSQHYMNQSNMSEDMNATNISNITAMDQSNMSSMPLFSTTLNPAGPQNPIFESQQKPVQSTPLVATQKPYQSYVLNGNHQPTPYRTTATKKPVMQGSIMQQQQVAYNSNQYYRPQSSHQY